ncbi:hypothetical protein [Massilia timonae]|nr:hypothetical protein [Massilia timonae]
MALESHPVVTPLGPRFIHGAVEIDQSFRATRVQLQQMQQMYQSN